VHCVNRRGDFAKNFLANKNFFPKKFSITIVLDLRISNVFSKDSMAIVESEDIDICNRSDFY